MALQDRSFTYVFGLKTLAMWDAVRSTRTGRVECWFEIVSSDQVWETGAGAGAGAGVAIVYSQNRTTAQDATWRLITDDLLRN